MNARPLVHRRSGKACDAEAKHQAQPLLFPFPVSSSIILRPPLRVRALGISYRCACCSGTVPGLGSASGRKRIPCQCRCWFQRCARTHAACMVRVCSSGRTTKTKNKTMCRKLPTHLLWQQVRACRGEALCSEIERWTSAQASSSRYPPHAYACCAAASPFPCVATVFCTAPARVGRRLASILAHWARWHRRLTPHGSEL